MRSSSRGDVPHGSCSADFNAIARVPLRRGARQSINRRHWTVAAPRKRIVVRSHLVAVAVHPKRAWAPRTALNRAPARVPTATLCCERRVVLPKPSPAGRPSVAVHQLQIPGIEHGQDRKTPGPHLS
jgi:hypothetical protein